MHLAGQRAVSASWAELQQPNIVGLVSTFEAAHRAGVRKIVFASTNHVTGMYDREQAWPLSPELPARPDSLYGVTKAFGEDLGRYYSDNFGISVVCLRLGWVLERPHNEQARWQWLSPDDLARLVSGALLSDVRFGIYYGVLTRRGASGQSRTRAWASVMSLPMTPSSTLWSRSRSALEVAQA